MSEQSALAALRDLIKATRAGVLPPWMYRYIEKAEEAEAALSSSEPAIDVLVAKIHELNESISLKRAGDRTFRSAVMEALTATPTTELCGKWYNWLGSIAPTTSSKSCTLNKGHSGKHGERAVDAPATEPEKSWMQEVAESNIAHVKRDDARRSGEPAADCAHWSWNISGDPHRCVDCGYTRPANEGAAGMAEDLKRVRHDHEPKENDHDQ